MFCAMQKHNNIASQTVVGCAAKESRINAHAFKNVVTTVSISI